MQHYKDPAAALSKAFPFIRFLPSKFSSLTRDKLDKYKNFFDVIAREKGWDPLNPLNWYSIDPKAIYSKKGGMAIKNAFGSFIKGLSTVYPNIGLQVHRFKARSKYKMEPITTEE